MMAWEDEGPISLSWASMIKCSPLKDELPFSEYSLQNSCLQGTKWNLVHWKFTSHRVQFTFRQCFITLRKHLYQSVYSSMWASARQPSLYCSDYLSVHRQCVWWMVFLESVSLSADCKPSELCFVFLCLICEK